MPLSLPTYHAAGAERAKTRDVPEDQTGASRGDLGSPEAKDAALSPLGAVSGKLRSEVDLGGGFARSETHAHTGARGPTVGMPKSRGNVETRAIGQRCMCVGVEVSSA